MKTILVGLDGTSGERDVLGAARELARRTGARLLLFRAIGLPTALPPDAHQLAPHEVTAMLEREAQAALETAAASVPGEHVAGVRVAIGTPWEAICRVAKEENCDLVVIGSHGYDTLDRVLGTTAAKVVNHADRSVLVVRSAERFLA